ncbi:hypothetical protein BH10PSE18_BH10PSE18_20820 [soil metagenome]
MKTAIAKFLRDEEGATAIEYGLIAGLIAVAIAVAVGGVGEQLTTLFGTIKTKLINAPAAG